MSTLRRPFDISIKVQGPTACGKSRAIEAIKQALEDGHYLIEWQVEESSMEETVHANIVRKDPK